MSRKRTPIGKFMIARGLLSVEQERAVAEEQKKLAAQQQYEAFGRIAVRKGFVSSEAVKSAMKERAGLEKK